LTNAIIATMLDLRIVNGSVLTETGVRELDVGIADGKIVSLDDASGRARAEVDATGLHVLPGAIDIHFHCRAPSYPQRGDFASETRAAAAGGVTTVFEMPISDPACSTPEIFRERRDLAESQAWINVALYSGAALSASEAMEMAEIGAVGFKLFMVAPAPGREREFSGVWATDEGAILEALRGISATGRVCVVHAENDRLLRHFEATSTADPIPLRPPVIEATAISAVAALAAEATAKIHIAHVSSRSAVAALRASSALEVELTGETCPHYLVLDSRSIAQHGGVARVGPPLRSPDDQRALWEALDDGTLAVVASDHAPFLLHEKATPEYRSAPQGLPSVELLMPVMLDAASRGILPLQRVSELLSAKPAALFGLAPEKGAIRIGADADIAIAALGAPWPGPRSLFSRGAGCGIVFEGVNLSARIEATVVNGELVFKQGVFRKSSAGGFVTPARETAKAAT
jgi:dihydroorotase (multifunctional complex type)